MTGGPPFMSTGQRESALAAQNAVDAARMAQDHQAWQSSRSGGRDQVNGSNVRGPNVMDGLPSVLEVVQVLVAAGCPEAQPIYRTETVKGRFGRSKSVTSRVGEGWKVGRYEISGDWRHSWGSDSGTQPCEIWIDSNGRFSWVLYDERQEIDDPARDTEVAFVAEAIRTLMDIASRHNVGEF